jgi:CobQ-like glutamine amidotransferase family enzyme
VTDDSALTVVLVYPELLGTYGDRGNAVALRHRADARGLGCRVVEAAVRDPLPRSGDIYLVGGGEDAAMLLAWERLAAVHRLQDAVHAGAVCLGVCAGYQLLSREFTGPDGRRREGLGLLDVRCGRLSGPRAVGEVLAESDDGFVTGFENHQGDARLGAGATALARLVRGVGNGDEHTEGAVEGRVLGTYLHGPVLVRNDTLADRLLQLVVGPLAPFRDMAVLRLRRERRAAALGRPASRRAALRRLSSRRP